MRSMEFSGRTVDEAIFHGLNEMGVTIDQVDIITVQSETKGIFGFGARNAIVRLVERETPVVPDFTAINEERREQREERRERRDRKDDRPDGRGRGDKRSDRRREQPREEKEAAAPVEELPYSKELAEELAKEDELIFLCGHYEGVDERVLEEIVTDYISIGDYVLTGGELPALVCIDAIARLVPGVLGNGVSADTESFDDGLL